MGREETGTMSEPLVWEEFLNAERAQIGALDFFVCATEYGAELYCDSMSFDQGYGCVGHASVDAAKAAAEEIASHTHAELTALFAPVLRWDRDQHSVGVIDGNPAWWLEADCEEWAVWALDGVRRYAVRRGYKCTTRELNRCSAEAALRSLGVTFRTEDGQ